MQEITLDSCIKENEKKWFDIKNPEESDFPQKSKIIHDSIYGTIKIEIPIVFLIDLPCFQRLRRIRQLGFLDLVYPGAHHNRFEHSIGSSYLSGQFLVNMKSNNEELSEILTEQTILENKIAALYHDIGHLPFSHVTEDLLYNEASLIRMIRDQRLEDFKPHELLSAEFVRGDYISKAINRINEELGYDLSPSSISGLILGKAPESDRYNRFLGQIIHGPIDVDRMDYLNRDAYYSGVPFSKIDMGRILQTVNVHKGYGDYYDFIIDYKGIQAIEALIVSRALMYSSVYYHHTARASSLLFSRTAYSFFRNYNRCFFELCNYDDNSLINLLQTDEEASTNVNNILYRKLPKRALTLKGDNLTDLLSFETFQNSLNMETLIEIENEIGEGTLLDIPKLPEYEEIHVFILFDDTTTPIADISSIVKGVVEKETRKLNWLGYVFSISDDLPEREKIAESAIQYFKEKRTGITV